MLNVIIGIQARSTSKRFPRKVFEKIGGITVIQHVINAAEASALYINEFKKKSGISVKTVLLVPMGDEIVGQYKYKMPIVEGEEDNVLSRYLTLSENENPDYIVRITADCPLIPPFIISKAIFAATKNNLDYVSNVDENIRTFADGYDVEVISRKAIDWLRENALDAKDKEHVTLAIRWKQNNLNIGHIVGTMNLSDKKLSVDTHEDLENVRAEYELIQKYLKEAVRRHGKKSIFRL